MLAITSADSRERERWKNDVDRERERWKSDQQLEREKWHRDQLLKVCSETIRVARTLQLHYNLVARTTFLVKDSADFDEHVKLHYYSAQDERDKLLPLAHDMQLLGESGLYLKCYDIKELAEEVDSVFVRFHKYLVENYARLQSVAAGDTAARDGLNAEIMSSKPCRDYADAMEDLNIYRYDFTTAARQKISPSSLPESELESAASYATSNPQSWPDRPETLPNIFARPRPSQQRRQAEKAAD